MVDSARQVSHRRTAIMQIFDSDPHVLEAADVFTRRGEARALSIARLSAGCGQPRKQDSVLGNTSVLSVYPQDTCVSTRTKLLTSQRLPT